MNDKTLLLVDDEPQIRRVLQTTLCEAGYCVILAKNGQEGTYCGGLRSALRSSVRTVAGR